VAGAIAGTGVVREERRDHVPGRVWLDDSVDGPIRAVVPGEYGVIGVAARTLRRLVRGLCHDEDRRGSRPASDALGARLPRSVLDHDQGQLKGLA
jgi:hypothetical protein